MGRARRRVRPLAAAEAEGLERLPGGERRRAERAAARGALEALARVGDRPVVRLEARSRRSASAPPSPAPSSSPASAACSGSIAAGSGLGGCWWGKSTTAPLTGAKTTSNGPARRAICHQAPWKTVSPRCSTRLPPASTSQETCGSPSPSTAGSAVQVNGPTVTDSQVATARRGSSAAASSCSAWASARFAVLGGARGGGRRRRARGRPARAPRIGVVAVQMADEAGDGTARAAGTTAGSSTSLGRGAEARRRSPPGRRADR